MSGEFKKIRFPLPAIFILVIAMIGSYAQSDSASTLTAQDRTTARDSGREDRAPLAKYNASQPVDLTERTSREARGRRYDEGRPKSFNVSEPTANIRNLPLNSHFWVGIPAIPASQSDAILLGTVTQARAYLSNDKTGIYSEFTVHVEEVLKNNGRGQVLTGDSVAVEREGGAVQFQSGRIEEYRIFNQGMPQSSERYVLFLRYNEEGQDFSIITGYRLIKGRVFPLDDVGPFASHKDVDETVFLREVRVHITHRTRSSNPQGDLVR